MSAVGCALIQQWCDDYKKIVYPRAAPHARGRVRTWHPTFPDDVHVTVRDTRTFTYLGLPLFLGPQRPLLRRRSRILHWHSIFPRWVIDYLCAPQHLSLDIQ